jgi:hypothetical protein
MKSLCIPVFACLMFAACTQDPKTSSEAAVPPSPDSLKNAFIPIFNGVWAMSDYIKDIEQTKSPFKSHAKLQGVVALIAGTEAEGDSMLIDASWNNHEGFSFYVHFSTGRRPHSLPTSIPDFDVPDNSYELGYEGGPDNRELILYHYAPDGKLLDKRSFTKIRNYQPDDDLAWGLQYAVNEKLISGTYQLTQGAKSPVQVTFTAEGATSGLGNFTTYRVTTDFMDAFQNSFDYICFYEGQEQPKGNCFVFEIKENTLNLYESVPNPDTEVEEKGKLVYVLEVNSEQ